MLCNIHGYIDKICIKYNDDVNVDDFVPVTQEDLWDHGIKSVVFDAKRPNKLRSHPKLHTVDRWGDFAPYGVALSAISNIATSVARIDKRGFMRTFTKYLSCYAMLV